MISAFEDFLYAKEIAQAILEARPDLTDHVEVSDSRPVVTLPLKHGAVLAAKVREGAVARWIVAVPNDRGTVEFVRPEGTDKFAAEMIAAFDRLTAAGR
jgi:hypothetical protein